MQRLSYLVVAACAAAIGGQAQAAATTAAVEYYHRGFDHYFVTAYPAEAAALDAAGPQGPWARTGQAYAVFPDAGPGLEPVCRFFSTAFAPKSSHFYTAEPAECAQVKTNAAWQYEADAYFVNPAAGGSCGAGTAPLFRLYNDGQGGAPNHRYTTCTAIRDRMLGKGWVSEGVAMCVAAASADCATDTSAAIPVVPGAFRGSIALGAPTATSIKANVFAPDQAGRVSIAYGTASGVYDRQTAPVALAAGTPVELAVEGLAADTRYYYRLDYQAADGVGSGVTAEYAFHTARPAGSTFTFTIQADSHLDENSDFNQYQRTLANVLADAPDFHVDLGDTFMTEKHADPLSATSPPAANEASVDARYRYERANFGAISHSAPIFLVNGNHEGEAGWLADGTANNLAIWTTKARLDYFVNPVPDGFYGGDATDEPFVGKRASWYAWNWGDALFVVLDPYWYTKSKIGNDGWALTLGERQFTWLQQTLAASRAKFKFVFIHSLVGGLDGAIRGGIEAAPYFEWGGRNLDGTNAFAQKRAGWSMPIHPLLTTYGVTAVFHGHDHVYVKQSLDGIVYQEVPQPSARNTSSGASIASDYHYVSGTILSSAGHLRVTVGPDGVTSRYVRAWLPASENAQRRNGQVDDTWSVGAPQGNSTP